MELTRNKKPLASTWRDLSKAAVTVVMVTSPLLSGLCLLPETSRKLKKAEDLPLVYRAPATSQALCQEHSVHHGRSLDAGSRDQQGLGRSLGEPPVLTDRMRGRV